MPVHLHQFTCFTGTKVQILTPEGAAPAALRARPTPLHLHRQIRGAVCRSRGAQFTCFTLCCSSVAALLQLCCVNGEVLSLLAFLVHYWYKGTNTDAARADLERAAPRGEALLALLVQKYKY